MVIIEVCSKSRVKKAVKQTGATWLITLLDPGDTVFKPPSIPPSQHLKLSFYDEEDPTKANAPLLWHAEAILAFAKNIPDNNVVLVHCLAGRCRSTAAALAIWCQMYPHMPVAVGAKWLQQKVPEAVPNLLLAQHFDTLLGKGGDLVLFAKLVGDEATENYLKEWNDDVNKRG